METRMYWDSSMTVLVFWTNPKLEVKLHNQKNYAYFFSASTQISLYMC